MSIHRHSGGGVGLTERERARQTRVEGSKQTLRSPCRALCSLLDVLLGRDEVAQAETTAAPFVALFLLPRAVLLLLLCHRGDLLLIDDRRCLFGQVDVGAHIGRGCGGGEGGKRRALAPDQLDQLVLEVAAGGDDLV